MTERRCLVTGVEADTGRMVRFVQAPDGAFVADLAGRLPGRGHWVLAQREAIDRAARRFAEESDRPADDLAQQVEHALARRCTETLGLARKSGSAVCGFEKVRAVLQRVPSGLLLTAHGAGEDGRRKLLAIAPSIATSSILTGRELSLALGRENVVHAALRPGGLTDRIAVDLARLAGLRQPRCGERDASNEDCRISA
jgi:predicted RNA-binding protein YlxR (DUF448 family)